jgi:hypothetical protein
MVGKFFASIFVSAQVLEVLEALENGVVL